LWLFTPLLLSVAYALDDGQVKILVILLNLCYASCACLL
jgi:hypothetical protein